MAAPYSYAGKRVVVTGGASGVGAALVRLLDTLSTPDVVVLDVHEPAGLTSSQRWLPTDLADPASIAATVEALGPVDVLFNNAGVAGTASAETVSAVNFLALRALTEAVGAGMSAGGGGRLASPEDIALVLAFLGMEASRHVNGVNLYADGGSTAGRLTGTIDVSELVGHAG